MQDKGSRFVLTDLTYCENRIFGQLNNVLHYKQLSSDPTIEYVKLAEKWCSKWLLADKISF